MKVPNFLVEEPLDLGGKVHPVNNKEKNMTIFVPQVFQFTMWQIVAPLKSTRRVNQNEK